MADLTLQAGAGSRVDAEIEVKRSRFLCRLVRTETEEAARIEAELRQHGVLILGTDYGREAVLRMSGDDDGERLAALVAQATAGGAALQALGHEWVDVTP
jgi:putative IMPACT (imprinted ancient) family translation regulator